MVSNRRLRLGQRLAWILAVGVALCAPSTWGAALEAYVSETSVTNGDTLELHVSSQFLSYRLSIWRQGSTLDRQLAPQAFRGYLQTVPPNAWEGCHWPITNRIHIPLDWRPGAYLARLDGDSYTAWIPFVVRSKSPGSVAPILVQLSINTYQAYNRYGGKGLYGAFAPGLQGRAYKVSFERPYSYFASDGSGQFFLWESPFIRFLESEGYLYEVCTNIDVHRDPTLLDHYRLFCSVGHDEYYSKEMFDALERFSDAGGNLAFFSANTLWWQVRFEDSEHTMVCYKDRSIDPLAALDPSRATVNWHYVGRPPAALMGIYYNGSSGIPQGSFQVVNPHHWAFQGAAVDSGQSFGYPMVAMEVDSRTSDSPRFLDLIARTELPDGNNGGVMRPAEMVYYEKTPDYGFAAGQGGKVFAGATVNYAQGLVDYFNGWTKTRGFPDPVARTITVNVLDRLGCSLGAPSPALPKEGADVAASRVLLQWYPSRAQRSGYPIRYKAYWEGGESQLDSVETTNLSAWITVDTDTVAYQWWVSAESECGNRAQSNVHTFRTLTPTDSHSSLRVPVVSALADSRHAEIRIELDTPRTGTTRIFGVSGRLVADLGTRQFEPAVTLLDWNLHDASHHRVASGTYVIQIRFGNSVVRTKLVVVR